MPPTDSPQPGPDRALGGDGSPAVGSHAGLEAVLTRWIGLDSSTLGSATLARACQRRLEASGLSNLDALWAAVENDPRQRDLLVEEVVVSESWFFRDEQTFAFLESFVRTIAAMPGRQPVRILSVPCACGEEPYSIAMRLFDAGLPAEAFSIDAFDVSHACLERAKAGCYSANAFRNADQDFRRRWFQEEGRRSVIAPAIREQVHFAWGNLLDPGFAAGAAGYDLIFCRNLLIYLTTDARRQVEKTLDRLLSPDGALVLGAAEPPIMQGGWLPAGASSMFALRRRTSSGGHSSGQGFARRGSRDHIAVSRWPSKHARTLRQPVSPALAGPLKAELAKESSEPERLHATLAALLEKAGRLANAGRHTEAISLCEAHARDAGPTPFFSARHPVSGTWGARPCRELLP
jgi:chemotaxis protein methyltransferase WspC